MGSFLYPVIHFSTHLLVLPNYWLRNATHDLSNFSLRQAETNRDTTKQPHTTEGLRHALELKTYMHWGGGITPVKTPPLPNSNLVGEMFPPPYSNSIHALLPTPCSLLCFPCATMLRHACMHGHFTMTACMMTVVMAPNVVTAQNG